MVMRHPLSLREEHIYVIKLCLSFVNLKQWTGGVVAREDSVVSKVLTLQTGPELGSPGHLYKTRRMWKHLPLTPMLEVETSGSLKLIGQPA